ncbi:hypothetical protein L596_017333 [Steinernema carpocapsae]|uniref:Uncharacterized protein n=1 Tax=Steinernema carpocapsae TaxID=34508 RepID=A0A4U5N1Q1_STECR|nr:hypothetical protein L596_017333 [Steinernema carpocapsae]
MKTLEYNKPLFMVCVLFKPLPEQDVDIEYINGLLSAKPHFQSLRQKNLQEFAEEAAAKKLEIDIENTKIMARKKTQIQLNGKRLAQVDSFDHFGQHIAIFRSKQPGNLQNKP